MPPTSSIKLTGAPCTPVGKKQATTPVMNPAISVSDGRYHRPDNPTLPCQAICIQDAELW